MTMWQSIETAPKGIMHSVKCPLRSVPELPKERCFCDATQSAVLVYGQAGVRFARQDELGQWRNMMGRPMYAPPTHWMPIPELPPTEEKP